MPRRKKWRDNLGSRAGDKEEDEAKGAGGEKGKGAGGEKGKGADGAKGKGKGGYRPGPGASRGSEHYDSGSSDDGDFLRQVFSLRDTPPAERSAGEIRCMNWPCSRRIPAGSPIPPVCPTCGTPDFLVWLDGKWNNIADYGEIR